MTDTEMPAGRALDARIALDVMDWQDVGWDTGHPSWYGTTRDGAAAILPHYSTSIADAWTVVESSACEGGHKFSLWEDLDWWYASISGYVEARGATAAEAICRAALRAVQGRTP